MWYWSRGGWLHHGCYLCCVQVVFLMKVSSQCPSLTPPPPSLPSLSHLMVGTSSHLLYPLSGHFLSLPFPSLFAPHPCPFLSPIFSPFFPSLPFLSFVRSLSPLNPPFSLSSPPFPSRLSPPLLLLFLCPLPSFSLPFCSEC